jgi:SAM-dependent methyltransferase
MMAPNPRSLTPEFFEALYEANPDPWQFTTSAYEAQKYDATLTALTKPLYQNALEIGGSIGVLTEKLGDRCTALLSLDVSKAAQAQAIERCRHLSNITFQLMCVPHEFPDQQFDLVLLSEVGYYWCWDDFYQAQRLIIDHLHPGGQLLLVHWTVDAKEMPLTGDQVHDSFCEQVPTPLRHLKSQREMQYRLDLFERV